MYPSEEQPGTSKKRLLVITVLGLILVIVSVILAGLLWQKKQNTQAKRAIQTNLQVEADSAENSKKNEAEPVNASSLGFNNQLQPVKTDETFSLNSTIDPKGKKITAAELHITFDPKALKLESIVPSDTFSLELYKAKIDNEKGTASISLGVPVERPAVSEISTIATFNFKSLSSSGNTEVKFSDQTKIAAEGQSTNALASSSPATVTMQK